MTELAESLRKCKVEGNVLYLPSIKEGALKNYNEVKSSLLKAGAKYKSNSFVFPNDAQPYIDKLTGGEKINIKKEFQFFGTSASLADEVVKEADIKKTHKVLEPSAGQGAIVEAITRKVPTLIVDVCELMDINRNVLKQNSNIQFVGEDFLQIPSKYVGYYDRIIANPPFNKNQDIDHIRKMYECLKVKGRLVSIASKHWQTSTNKKETEFREWLKAVGAKISEVDAGRFKESGTNIATCIIVINK